MKKYVSVFMSLLLLAACAVVPIFLSTHPTNEDRIKAARDYLPEAMEYYSSGRQ